MVERQSNSKRRRASSRRARKADDRLSAEVYEELNRITDRIEEIMGLVIVAGDALGNPDADCAHEVQIVLRINGSNKLYGQILELRKLAQTLRPSKASKRSASRAQPST